jgi:ABC-2 type transport system ATP-binding protein
MVTLAIETKDLTRRFGGICAVDRVSLQVPSGVIFGFLGPNGAGKTTTLRLLLGLLELHGGTATVLGYDVATEADKIRERTGVLLEHDGLYLRLSAYDNLEFFGRIYRLDAVTRRTRSQELLKHLGLWERSGDSVSTFSKGMRQKLAMARALLHRPSVIFLDEPSSGLDPVAAVALREDIRNLASRDGTTVFLTTHNLAEAEKVCDLVGVIRQGQLIACDTPERLRLGTRQSVVQIYGSGFHEGALAALRSLTNVRTVEMCEGHLQVELSPGAAAAPLVNLLVRAGVEVEEVRKDQGSLEEAFVTLVQEGGEMAGS